MRITKRQLRALIKEAVTTSQQFSNSGFISLESDPYDRIEITSDGDRITIDMNDFMMFLKKAGLSSGVMQEAPVRVDDSTFNRISHAREALGDDEFIMALVSRIKPVELDDTLTRIFRDLNLEVDGVQYF